MKKVIILNAPPNSGKDTIADILAQNEGVAKAQFKDELYKATAEFYGVSLAETIELASNRKTKEIPHPYFDMKSPRQALIHVSEDVYKPQYGSDYFGLSALIEILNTPQDIVVFSDGGFKEEVEILSKSHVLEVFVIRLHRKGYTFAGDSRNYIEGDHIDIDLIDGNPMAAAMDIAYICNI